MQNAPFQTVILLCKVYYWIVITDQCLQRFNVVACQVGAVATLYHVDQFNLSRRIIFYKLIIWFPQEI